MIVATARIDYRSKPGQLALNTTRKSGQALGALFAPEWDMIMASKTGRDRQGRVYTWADYTRDYYALMRQRWSPAFYNALWLPGEMVLCCYCKDTHATTRHCHRYLLVDIFQTITTNLHIPFEYKGEYTNVRR